VDGDVYEVEIAAEVAFVEAQSDPDKDQYVFAYTMTIHNAGQVEVTLLSRHWIITDANGQVQEVRGEGVVGEKPSLKPGETYRYTSGSMLQTPVGSMRGSYQMLAEDGHEFDAEIAAFTLALPGVLH
jgi:ApaG protein